MDGKEYCVALLGVRMTNQTDSSLIQIFLPIINNSLIANGFSNVVVEQSSQPTMQGINTKPSIYFFKVGSKRYGYLGRDDVWDADAVDMVHSEKQYYESTWQVMALVLQSPLTPNAYTASDLVTEVSSIMQSDSTRDILNQNGIGILRVQEISNPYFVDDRDNFEASPAFEFVLVYLNTRVSSNNYFDTFTAGIYPI
jgi:hypothetical protein